MAFSDDVDLAYREAESQPDDLIPEGSYRVRVASAREVYAKSTGSPGIRLEFVIVEGPEKGSLLGQDYWLAGGALPRTKRTLERLGFPGLSPSEVVAFREFPGLPTVRVEVRHREYQGQTYAQVVRVEQSTTESRDS